MKHLTDFLKEGKLANKFSHQVAKFILGKEVAVKPIKFIAKIIEAMSDAKNKTAKEIAQKCLKEVDINNKKEFKNYLLNNRIVSQWKDIKNEDGFVDNDTDINNDNNWVVIYGELGKKWTVLRWGFDNWEGTLVPYRELEDETGYAVDAEDIKKTLLKEADNVLA